MTNKIRIGVLGCANIARRSMIPAILKLSTQFELVGVASRSAEKAAMFAEEFGCAAFVGYDSLLAAEDVDAVYIPLPTGLHAEWIGKALRAGKHVYAEKSIANGYPDAQDMVANARHQELALMEGFMFQYHSQHQEVIKLLNAGVIGELRHFHSSFGFPPLPEGDFRYDDRIGGGVLLDAAGYPLRAAHFLLGDSLTVRAATLHHDAAKGTATYGSAFLANASGVGASLAFGFDNLYQCHYEIWGQHGKIRAERAFTPRADFSPKIVVETAAGTEVIQSAPDNHFERALEKFASAVKDPQGRERLYEEILIQSRSLALMKHLHHASGTVSPQ